MAGLLTFVRDEIVHLDPGSYMWVSIKRFSMCDADATDQQALTALLDQHEYTITTQANRSASKITTRFTARTC